MRAPLAIAVLVALAGCVQGDTVIQDTSRTVAKGVVNQIISSRLPGVNAAPYTDCIIDNASTAEILNVAGAAATGVTGQTVDIVLGIAQRPATLDCLARAQPGLLGALR